MIVWDVQAGCQREVSLAEARAGMIRYARSLGPGTAACGELERLALALQPPGRAPRAADVKAGDVILHPDHSAAPEPGCAVHGGRCAGDLADCGYRLPRVRCTALRDAESAAETAGPLAGLPCTRIWCRREDTGTEGWLTYGPAATVTLDYQRDPDPFAGLPDAGAA